MLSIHSLLTILTLSAAVLAREHISSPLSPRQISSTGPLQVADQCTATCQPFIDRRDPCVQSPGGSTACRNMCLSRAMDDWIVCFECNRAADAARFAQTREEYMQELSAVCVEWGQPDPLGGGVSNPDPQPPLPSFSRISRSATSSSSSSATSRPSPLGSLGVSASASRSSSARASATTSLPTFPSNIPTVSAFQTDLLPSGPGGGALPSGAALPRARPGLALAAGGLLVAAVMG